MPDPMTDTMMTHLEGMASRLGQLLPWVKQLDAAERAELLSDPTQAWFQVRQTGQTEALTEVLEDWEATAEPLTHRSFMETPQHPYDPNDFVPWEQVQGGGEKAVVS